MLRYAPPIAIFARHEKARRTGQADTEGCGSTAATRLPALHGWAIRGPRNRTYDAQRYSAKPQSIRRNRVHRGSREPGIRLIPTSRLTHSRSEFRQPSPEPRQDRLYWRSFVTGGNVMAARKPFLGPTPSHPELDRLREETRNLNVTDEEMAEQRISFICGNAPAGSSITKESARAAAQRFRITRLTEAVPSASDSRERES
jgi:hypothetical protein